MRNKILLFSLLIWSMLFQWVNAWVVPGTIQKSSTSANPYCSYTLADSYYPSWVSCNAFSKTANGYGWFSLYDSHWVNWTTWYSAPFWYVSIDSWESCKWQTSWGSYSPASNYTATCNFWSWSTDSESYYAGWSNGSCDSISWQSNLITWFNQVGVISRSAPSTWGWCTVEWRYAQNDDKAPDFKLNSVAAVFKWDDSMWCNISKYRDVSADLKNYPWCEAYKKLNPSVNAREDLLKWLNITIDPDESWIFKVDIKIWSCSTSYQSPQSDASILVSTTSPNWVKSQYTNWFVIPYSWNFIAFWVSQVGLLEKFWVSRLDQCLSDWKNYLLVSTFDMARWWDGVSMNSNKRDYKSPAIFIDNNVSIIEPSWDLAKYSPSYDMWRNFSLQWNIQVWEEIANGWNSCNAVISTWSCIWSLPSWYSWVAPVWVDPNTWIFTKYTCDGFTFPESSECKMWKNFQCTGTIPSSAATSNMFWLIADTPWQNTNPSWKCYYKTVINYCKVWWSIPCVIKPWVVVTPWLSCTDMNTLAATVYAWSPFSIDPVPAKFDWEKVVSRINCAASDIPCNTFKSNNPNWWATFTCEAWVWKVAISNEIQINAQCWASNWGSFNSAPTNNLCNSWVPTTVQGTWPWSWNCAGSWNGQSVSCSASKMNYGAIWDPKIRYNWSCYNCSTPRYDGWADYRWLTTNNWQDVNAWLTIFIDWFCPATETCTSTWTINDTLINGSATVEKQPYLNSYSLWIDKWCAQNDPSYHAISYQGSVQVTNTTRWEVKTLDIWGWSIELFCSLWAVPSLWWPF